MRLEELLRSKSFMVLDGAMGTELDKRGATGRGECNLTAPDAVIQVHKDYIEAGSNALITNTLTMNRVFIDSHRLSIDVGRVNLAGAKLARQAADSKGGQVFVLGNLSSTGQMLEPYGSYSEEALIESFKEQAGLLLDGGVDGFIIETMFDLREAVCALTACKEVSGLPTIACIAYDTQRNGGRTVMGNSAADCASVLEEHGADAIGANCGGIDPDQMAEIVATLESRTRLPVVAEPNAGKPRLVGGETVFDMDAGTFASGMSRCVKAGAKILGGCCGTSPEHIAALSAMLRPLMAGLL